MVKRLDRRSPRSRRQIVEEEVQQVGEGLQEGVQAGRKWEEAWAVP
jgi:hypothetical protein